jgi:hypothetical protein
MPDAIPAPERSVHDGHPAQLYEVKIDRDRFGWDKSTISGEQLRHLPTPPIGPDRDLYEEVHAGEDKPVESNTVVTLNEDEETCFFTAPHHVTPGV